MVKGAVAKGQAQGPLKTLIDSCLKITFSSIVIM